jgi:hypothetical protein
MRTARQTDMTKLTIVFRKFSEAPKRYIICNHFNLWLFTFIFYPISTSLFSIVVCNAIYSLIFREIKSPVVTGTRRLYHVESLHNHTMRCHLKLSGQGKLDSAHFISAGRSLLYLSVCIILQSSDFCRRYVYRYHRCLFSKRVTPKKFLAWILSDTVI